MKPAERRGTKAHAPAAAVALLALASSAAAQTAVCPHDGNICFETGIGCGGGQSQVWEEGLCGCQPGYFFYMNCWGEGMSGSYPCPGSTGNDCTFYPCYAAPDGEQTCPVSNTEPPSVPPPPPPQVPPPPTSGGCPISFTTGAMFFTHTDAVVGDLAVTRTFNSGWTSIAARYGAFGPGWNASFDRRLNVMTTNTIEARLPDGSPQYYFDHDDDGAFDVVLPYSKESRIDTVAGGYTEVFRRGSSAAYDSTGKALSVTDGAGVVTTFSRDSQGRLTSMARLGRSVDIAYSGSSTKPAQISSSGTLLAVYTYDASGRLEAVSYPGGGGYHYTYANGQIVHVTDASGTMIEAHEYDVLARATTSEIGDGVEKLTFAYGANQTTVTDAAGNATTYEYKNVRGTRRVTKVTGPCTSCGGGGGDVQEWAYDEFGNVTSYENALGEIWTYTYDSSNNLLTETDPLNRVTTYTYDSQGRVLTTSRPGGGLTTLTHGSAGPLTITEKVAPRAS